MYIIPLCTKVIKLTCMQAEDNLKHKPCQKRNAMCSKNLKTKTKAYKQSCRRTTETILKYTTTSLSKKQYFTINNTTIQFSIRLSISLTLSVLLSCFPVSRVTQKHTDDFLMKFWERKVTGTIILDFDLCPGFKTYSGKLCAFNYIC